MVKAKDGVAAEEVFVEVDPNLHNKEVKLTEVLVKVTGCGGQPTVEVVTKLAVGLTFMLIVFVVESLQKADVVISLTV